MVLGVMIFIGAALLNAYTANMLLRNAYQLPLGVERTYESLALHSYGVQNKRLLRCILLVSLFGSICGSLMTMAPVSALPKLSCIDAHRGLVCMGIRVMDFLNASSDSQIS